MTHYADPQNDNHDSGNCELCSERAEDLVPHPSGETVGGMICYSCDDELAAAASASDGWGQPVAVGGRS